MVNKKLKVEWSINKERFDGKSRSKVDRGFSKEALWWDPAGSDRLGASNIQNLKFEPPRILVKSKSIQCDSLSRILNRRGRKIF